MLETSKPLLTQEEITVVFYRVEIVARQYIMHPLLVAPATDMLVLVPQVIFRHVEIIHGVDLQLLANLETTVRVMSLATRVIYISTHNSINVG